MTKSWSRTFRVDNELSPLSPKNAGDVFAGTIMGAIAAGENIEDALDTLMFAAQREAGKVIMNDPFYRKPLP